MRNGKKCSLTNIHLEIHVQGYMLQGYQPSVIWGLKAVLNLNIYGARVILLLFCVCQDNNSG